ncbi:hypothetical protein V493_02995 [Pseudogymnoascus sp. VKM F-4281 (FW-2241)]|nr:hypothetical protein V493_02995 [Pseudogymnoascus sp. VKM F-4281 (FW-2241)]
MSIGVPVPSPGALRALRQLALGTSCTVAFTTGLLTEDRRRRIHSAREVQENGRRIKSSRSYHGAAGATAVANFEDHVLNPSSYPVGNDKAAPNSIAPWANNKLDDPKGLVRAPLKDDLKPVIAKEKQGAFVDADLRARTDSHTAPAVIREIGPFRKHQDELASIMREILFDNKIGRIQSATSAFFEFFEDEPYIGNPPDRVLKRLAIACGQLFDVCQKHNLVGVYVPVIQKLLSFGPIEEELFYDLHAPEVIAYLLRKKKNNGEKDQAQLEALRSASSMYMTKFQSEPPKIPHPQMRQLGALLCAKTMKEQLYELTDVIYWRMSGILGAGGPPCVNYLILANHAMGHHKSVLLYFKRLYVLTTPPKYEFDGVVKAVLDSCLRNHELGQAKNVIRTAAEMARSGGFKIRAEWALMVLGQHWRSTRNLKTTRELFSKLETFMDCIDMPQALYSAIIQFCVEDGNADQAYVYLDQHTMTNNGVVSLRTCGHLALLEAMKGDWEGVKRSFETMKPLLADELAKEKHAFREANKKHAQVFAPIFQLYAKDSTVAESEQFIRKAIDEYGLVPNIIVLNIMVAKYVKAKEMDSIPRWLETMCPFGLKPDSVSFNAMLSHYRDERDITFTDLLHLCQKMKAIDDNLLDQYTAQILRLVAVRETKGDRHAFTRFSGQIDSLVQNQEDNNSDVDYFQSMRLAMAKGQPVKTLSLYHTALKLRTIDIPPTMFALAIQAAINLRTDAKATTSLLSSAKERGIDISQGMAHLLMHQLDDRTLGFNDLKTLLRKNTHVFKEHGMPVPMGVATKVASVFASRRKPREALLLWEYYAELNGISRNLVDLSSLTVLMRVHITMENVEGVRWVLDTLEQNGIAPNLRFVQVLKQGIAYSKKRQPGGGSFREELKGAMECVREMRRRNQEENREVGTKLLDIMSAAVTDSKGVATDESVADAKPHAVEASATERQQEPTSQVDTAQPPIRRISITPREWNIPRDSPNSSSSPKVVARKVMSRSS